MIQRLDLEDHRRVVKHESGVAAFSVTNRIDGDHTIDRVTGHPKLELSTFGATDDGRCDQSFLSIDHGYTVANGPSLTDSGMNTFAAA